MVYLQFKTIKTGDPPCLSPPAEDMKDKTEEEIEMMKTMGFGSFDTTKVWYTLWLSDHMVAQFATVGLKNEEAEMKLHCMSSFTAF